LKDRDLRVFRFHPEDHPQRVAVAVELYRFSCRCQCGWAEGRAAVRAVAGLKGAVPILLGTFILAAGGAGTTHAYNVIFVVVLFSVVVQGGLVPVIARRLGVPMHAVEPQPWTVGMRLRQRPDGLEQLTVHAGSPAEGRTVGDLAANENVWIRPIQRDGKHVPRRHRPASR
jgi:cell volume regulation protein A